MDTRRKTVGSDKYALTVHSRLKQGTQGEVVRRRRLRSRIFLRAACVQPVNWRRGSFRDSLTLPIQYKMYQDKRSDVYEDEAKTTALLVQRRYDAYCM